MRPDLLGVTVPFSPVDETKKVTEQLYSFGVRLFGFHLCEPKNLAFPSRARLHYLSSLPTDAKIVLRFPYLLEFMGPVERRNNSFGFLHAALTFADILPNVLFQTSIFGFTPNPPPQSIRDSIVRSTAHYRTRIIWENLRVPHWELKAQGYKFSLNTSTMTSMNSSEFGDPELYVLSALGKNRQEVMETPFSQSSNQSLLGECYSRSGEFSTPSLIECSSENLIPNLEFLARLSNRSLTS